MSEPAVITRFLLVGGSCAVLNNILMIGGDALSLPLAASIAASFVVVCLIGYALHAAFTFGFPASWTGLGRYVLAMATSLPASALLLWLMVGALRWPMTISAPCATAATLILNFVGGRRAISGPPPPPVARTLP